MMNENSADNFNTDNDMADTVESYFFDPENDRVVKVGRNEPCPCGSDKKYKKCCLNK